MKKLTLILIFLASPALAQQATFSVPVILTNEEVSRIYIILGQAEAQALGANPANPEDPIIISARQKLISAALAAQKAASDAAAVAASKKASP